MVAASTPTAASTVADAATSPKAAAELVDSAVRLEPLVHVGSWGDRRRRAVRTVLDTRSVGRFTRSRLNLVSSSSGALCCGECSLTS